LLFAYSGIYKETGGYAQSKKPVTPPASELIYIYIYIKKE